MDDKLLKIIKRYGINNQLKKFSEESYELEEAILQYEIEMAFRDLYEIVSIDTDLRKHIIEELADCEVILNQFKLYYGITDEEIKETMEYKINRQIDRIEKSDELLKRLGDKDE